MILLIFIVFALNIEQFSYHGLASIIFWFFFPTFALAFIAGRIKQCTNSHYVVVYPVLAWRNNILLVVFTYPLTRIRVGDQSFLSLYYNISEIIALFFYKLIAVIPIFYTQAITARCVLKHAKQFSI